MTEFKNWGYGAFLWLAATFPALAQQERLPAPGDAEMPSLVVVIIAAVLLIIVGAVVSNVLRKPKETVIVTRDLGDAE